jgi:hypothetical protein
MTSKPKRPLSVWITQIILGIYGTGIFLIVLWGLYKGLSEGIPNPELYIVTTVGILTLVAVFIGGVWGMAIRKPWGRWLGVAGLVVLLISGAITQTSRLVEAGKSASGFGIINLIFAIFLVIGLAVLAFMSAAGDAADKFFSGKSTKVSDIVVDSSDSSAAPNEHA